MQLTSTYYIQNLWFLIYNEFKKYFSIFVQNQIIRKINITTSKLSEKQFKSDQQSAKKVFGKKLNNFEILYKTDFNIFY